MSAPEFLAQAGAIMQQRAAQYDQPGGERSMGRTIEAFNIITGRELTEAEGWLMMQLLKDVRQWQTPGVFHRDSAEDGVAYSALKAEALARNSETRQPAHVKTVPAIHTRCIPGQCAWQFYCHPDRSGEFKCNTCGNVSATLP